MNLTGRTKIQLFNAQTGEEEFVVEEKNMITNAVNRLLSPPDSIFNTASQSTNAFLGVGRPIATSALGGLLLFDRHQPEDPNQLMPTTDSVVAGHAGGEYAGSNITRGSYNTRESFWVYKDDPLTINRRFIGRRHVWDFGTSKANGQIGCACLTSLDGGDAGFTTRGVTGQSDNVSIWPTTNLTDFSYLFNTGSTSWGYIVDPVSGASFSNFYLITTRSDGTMILGHRINSIFYLLFLKIPKLNEINPGYSISSNSALTDVKYIKTIEIPNIIGGSNQASWRDNYILLNDSRHISLCFIINNSQINRYIIDVFNGELVSESILDVVGIPGTYTITNRVCSNMDDEFYFSVEYTSANAGSSETGLTGTITPLAYFKVVGSTVVFQDWVRIFERSTDPTRVIQFSNYLFNLRGWFCWTQSNAGLGCLIAHGRWHETYSTSDTGTRGSHGEDDIFPWVRMRDRYGNSVVLQRCALYLGSINNLETPVVKTAAQTMKITYDLSWED